ncbi:50S ribosome-binding GTPase [Dactylosporangium sp. NBC_01737]|uniref:hypothetical protein n=1 Tax=Dactylosporangium sp. NBC_01737 TaxID=2975959 RepID=UPI002E13A9E0|nr:50S ribosome-binding GTPase [Dactylosporangium sp. NBC_01737]
MTETDIHLRINEALTGRRSQRAFVDQLSVGWSAMVGGLDRIVEMLETADRTVQQETGVPERARFRAAFDALLRQGRGLADVRGRIGDAARQIDAATARVQRETVNVGVIGSTKVGKSTLLRTITNLPETVVPSTRFNPTTASASSIYHTEGKPSATLMLHTWESFRDGYLAPLHEQAGLGPAPRDIDGFRAYRYPAAGSNDAAGAKADDYLRKLDAAHRSLASYEALLLAGARTVTVPFENLRPYLAYPRKETGDPLNIQPYHAVRSVRIEQSFLDGAATRLGLIDLPGSGEAGLDIDRQFLQQVKSEIDLLVMVKRGDRKGASYLAEDSYTRNLADSARGGVPLDDYYVVVVNRDRANDPEGEYFDNTVKSVRDASQERNIRVLSADVADRDEVLDELLHPLLRHLATRLAEMDRAVVREALSVASEVAADIAAFAGDVLRDGRELAHLLPDQEDEFRTLAEELRNDLADDLSKLVDRYDASLVVGDAGRTLTEAITEAVGDARAWVRGGLGHGDRATWTSKVRGQYVYGALEAKQDEYYRAKAEITKIFSRIDPSLDESVQQLWDDVAAVLRARLTQELVPDGSRALHQLRVTAESRRAAVIADALQRLCELKEDYGSVVLRVTQPVIRGVHWDTAPAAFASPPPPRAVPRPVAPQPQPVPPQPVPPQPVPPQPAPAAATTGSQWVVMPDGSRRRVSRSVTPTAGQDPDAQGFQRTAKVGVDGLYDELTAVVEHCIAELETALLAEVRLMTRTLAAAADRFFDSAIRTNRSERDYENLCRPNLRSIWPLRFDGGNARLAADLERLQEQARATADLSATVSGLSAGLRLSNAGAS